MGTAASVHGGGRKWKRKNKSVHELHENANNMNNKHKDNNAHSENENNLETGQNKGVNRTDHCIRADRTAAIVVHGCEEEYQTLVEELPEIIVKQLGPNMIAHPMIQGKYCLVRDDEEDEDHLVNLQANTKKSVVEQKSKLQLPVCGMSQPSFEGIKQKLNSLLNHKCLVVNVRSDPCLFTFEKGDWYPYAIRDYRSVQHIVEDPHQTGIDLQEIEVKCREEVINTVKAKRESVFYFYDDITFFENQPVAHVATAPDYLLVGEEVYFGAIVGKHGIRYIRLNFVPGRFPLEEEVDRFVDELRHVCSDSLPKHILSRNAPQPSTQPVREQNSFKSIIHKMELPYVLVTGHKMTEGSIQLGLVMAHLSLKALGNIFVSINPDCLQKELRAFNQVMNLNSVNSNQIPKQTASNHMKTDIHGKKNKKGFDEVSYAKTINQLKKGKFYFTRQLGRYLPFMAQIKDEVDQAIDDFDDTINLREQIMDSLIELGELRETDESDKLSMCKILYEKAIDQMERYHLLICFNAYLREQVQVRFSENFSTWMKQQPRLYQIMDFLDVSEWYASVDMLKYEHRVLVTDSSLHIDELSTRRITGLDNFRQLAGLPIYGSSQPDTNGIVNMHNVLTKAYWDISLKNVKSVTESVPKKGSEKSSNSKDTNSYAVIMPQMIWICLRDDYVIKYAGETCSWRSKRKPEDPILLRGVSGMELEEMEHKFTQAVGKIKPPCKLYQVNDNGNLSTVNIYSSGEKPDVLSLKQMFKHAFDPTNTVNVSSNSSALDATSTHSSVFDKIPDSYAVYLNEHAEYHRIPLPHYSQPPPPIFDNILRLMLTNARGLLASANSSLSLKHACNGQTSLHRSGRRSVFNPAVKEDLQLPSPSNALLNRVSVTNLLFFCENGRERTSLAMSIASLVYCHLFGFMFGYRVEEEERISLRDAKYTKGEFVIIGRLIRMLPRGHQLKREVDYVLDRCYESMSMMHFHTREEIYFTYVKARDEINPEKKLKLRKRSLAYLEKYFFLILFNAYLHDQQPQRWKLPFETWIQQVTHQVCFMNLLDNFGFPEFEEPDKLRRIRERWRPDFIPHPTLVGNFV
uniref:Paladin n=1 Tax=Trichobilharzia regenti TaxID=157069 RepID=A0AA85JB73_TRIRE|nr:unnamed protein product [Trichobilharzia regenti]